jgi:hypothetical protein
MDQMTEQETAAKLVRASDATHLKLQKAQKVRKSYGDVEDRAINALLKKEKEERK